MDAWKWPNPARISAKSPRSGPRPSLAAPSLAVAPCFTLTDAVRPAPRGGVQPREGYRVQVYRDKARRVRLPVLSTAISAERLFDAFLDLLEPLGPEVDLIVESSHATDPRGRRPSEGPDERERHGIDLPVLRSFCCDFEEMLVNDGCTGVAVLNEEQQLEVHFDEHKLLYVYAPNLAAFERVLRNYGVERQDDLLLLTEGEHVHCTQSGYQQMLDTFCHQLGVEEAVESASW